MTAQIILPDKELFHRSEIIEIFSNYTLTPSRKQISSLPTIEEVKETIQQVLNVEDISNRSRRRELSDARHIYGFICYYQRLGTYAEIGKAINRDHATILHSFKTTRDYLQLKGHTAFREKYNKVCEAIMMQYENIKL